LDPQATKKVSKCYNHLESYTFYLSLVGNWLVWKIGRGEQVLIGLDPWIGCKEAYKLPTHLIHELQRKGYHSLR
jgi:hypothetical protein